MSIFDDLAKAIYYKDKDGTLGDPKNVQDAIDAISAGISNNFGSVGLTSGGVVSPAGGETIDIALGTGDLRKTDSENGILIPISFDQLLAQTIPTDTVRFVGVEYNAGSPQVIIKSIDSWNRHTEFALACIVNEAGTLHIVNNPEKVVNGTTNILHRFYETLPFQRANRLGGLILTEKGTRNVELSEGELYDRINEFFIPHIDTSIAGTFDSYIGLTLDTAGVSQWDNDNYNNAGVKTSLGLNKFANQWWYVEADGDLVMVYGTAEYNTLAVAENEGAPSVLPNRLIYHGRLIARGIFQKGAATYSLLESAFDTTFNPSLATDHNSLANLTVGDVHSQYLYWQGRAAGQVINGGNATTETLGLRNNIVDDLGFDILGNGVLRVNTADYETLVVNDDDIPSKKYVDDAIAVENLLNRVTGTSNYLEPTNTLDNLHLNVAEIAFFTTSELQIFRNSGVTVSLFSASAVASVDSGLNLIRSRGTISSTSAVQNGDEIGSINFIGETDGSNYNNGGQIKTIVSGVVSAGFLPCDMVFFINPGGGATQEGMRLTKTKDLQVVGGISGALLLIDDIIINNNEVYSDSDNIIVSSKGSGNNTIISSADGNISIVGEEVSIESRSSDINIVSAREITLRSNGGNLNLIPTGGAQVVIDSHWSFDGKTLTAITNNDTIINAYAGRSVKVESVYFEDGSITLFSAAGDHTIDCIGGAGSGRPFILNGANASTTGGSPLNGGDIILDTGHNLFGGDDGEFYVKINNVTKLKVDTNGAVYMSDIYDDTVSTSPKVLHIQSDGKLGISTIASPTFAGIKVDSIEEKTGSAGVIVEEILFLDNVIAGDDLEIAGATSILIDSQGLLNVQADSGMTFNPAQTPVIMIFKGDTDANLVYIDANNNRLGVGKVPTSPYILDVDGDFQIGAGSGDPFMSFNSTQDVRLTWDISETRLQLQTQDTNGNCELGVRCGASGTHASLQLRQGNNAWTEIQQINNAINVTYGADTDSFVFNSQGIDVDFIVKGNTDNELLVIDAGADKVLVSLASASGIAKLQVGGDIRQLVNTYNVNNPPTNIDLNVSFGLATGVGAGFRALLDDNGGNANLYEIVSNGTSWWYNTYTKAA